MTTEPHWAATITDLLARIEARRNADPAASYTATLLRGDEDALLKKLIEEAGEAALAAKGGDRDQLIAELADLWFHCLVAMTRYNIALTDVAAALEARRGVGGFAEKASRGKSNHSSKGN